jgi:hypothetical protein
MASDIAQLIRIPLRLDEFVPYAVEPDVCGSESWEGGIFPGWLPSKPRVGAVSGGHDSFSVVLSRDDSGEAVTLTLRTTLTRELPRIDLECSAHV